MIRVRDIKELCDDELDFLSQQTFKNKGYMNVYLEVCRIARIKHAKDDFVCDVITKYNSIGGLDAWALIQNLLYRYEDYMDMNTWVPGAKRRKGHGSDILSFVGDRYKDKKISLWASRADNSCKLYEKFNTPPFYVFDSDEYLKNKTFKRFDFSKI